ncbi:Cmx/CmrA family chloramphenicol efflux MFS transporter [Pseudonocardia sp. CA-107938]|uniref:Cmx/CmrA family chloramphenicol efflux MFS transporter n=1 Tax=Pseudonocardia sp. CA-107938 TaxID=3240021 RepID=UPI003D8F2B45
MPLAVVVLGFAIFAQGTSELMLAGLLPMIVTDLGISVPQAGLLISGFAVGMLVGAPILAVATLRLPKRTSLLGFVGAFALAHAVGALAPNYAVLMASRIVAALVYAGFWAVATVTAVGLVPRDKRARAMGIVVGGLTVAAVAGLPLGTLVGEQWGWRAVFWTIAVLSAAAGVAIRLTVPAGVDDRDERPSVGAELRAMRNPRLWLAYSTNALMTTSVLVVFSYFAPMLVEVTGLPAGAVPAVLGLYGLGSVAGIALASRTADGWPTATLLVSLGALAVLAVVLNVVLASAIPAVITIGLFGMACFASNPALNARVFDLAGEAPTLAAATNISAFNLGITVGPAVGAAIIGAGLGYGALTWASAVAAVLAVGSVVALRVRTVDAVRV